MVRDVTERKRFEKEIAAEKESLAVTLRSIGDGVITTDVQGKIIMINNAGETLTGWSSREAIGQPLKTVFNIAIDLAAQARAQKSGFRNEAQSILLSLPENATLRSQRRSRATSSSRSPRPFATAKMKSPASFSSSAISPSVSATKPNDAKPRRWNNLACLPAELRTISTTCSPRSSAISRSLHSCFRRTTKWRRGSTTPRTLRCARAISPSSFSPSPAAARRLRRPRPSAN